MNTGKAVDVAIPSLARQQPTVGLIKTARHHYRKASVAAVPKNKQPLYTFARSPVRLS